MSDEEEAGQRARLLAVLSTRATALRARRAAGRRNGALDRLQVSEIPRRRDVVVLLPVLDEQDLPRWPRTRGECIDGPRPCEFVSCRHHLAIDVSEKTGMIREVNPGRELEELRETCSLDVADRGPISLEEIGEYLGVTREAVRQTEERLLRMLEQRVGPWAADAVADGPWPATEHPLSSARVFASSDVDDAGGLRERKQ